MILHDGIGPVLAYMVISTADNVMNAMDSGRAQIEAYAQSNAPWSDITGDARQGLTASVYEDGGEIVLELAHSVEYGIWLELIQDGNFAIIMPTLETLGPEVIEAAGGEVLSTRSTF
jgi:hypothetical protein